MGSHYAEVARKLAHNDFDRGFSLTESGLQEDFYQDGMCGLGAAEKLLGKVWPNEAPSIQPSTGHTSGLDHTPRLKIQGGLTGRVKRSANRYRRT